jgi:LPXTG-motif cell wall-anchored protein
VRCTTGPNLSGAPADGVSLHFGKAYDTTYDRSLNSTLDQAGAGVFTIVVTEGVPPSREVNGGESDIAYGVGGLCSSGDTAFAAFRRVFVVTLPTVSSTVATPVRTSMVPAAPATGLPKTGTRLAAPLTAATMLLVSGCVVWGARRRKIWSRER